MKKIMENIIGGIVLAAKKVVNFVGQQVVAAVNFVKAQPVKAVVYMVTGFRI